MPPDRSADSARCRTVETGTPPTIRSGGHRSDMVAGGATWCSRTEGRSGPVRVQSVPGGTSRSLSGTADQREGDIRFGLGGSLLEPVPLQKAQVATVMAATDLRIQRRGCRQPNAQQLKWILAIEINVELAAGGNLFASATVLSCQPQQFGDGIAQRLQQHEPLRERLGATLRGLIEPEEVVG